MKIKSTYYTTLSTAHRPLILTIVLFIVFRTKKWIETKWACRTEGKLNKDRKKREPSMTEKIMVFNMAAYYSTRSIPKKLVLVLGISIQRRFKLVMMMAVTYSIAICGMTWMKGENRYIDSIFSSYITTTTTAPITVFLSPFSSTQNYSFSLSLFLYFVPLSSKIFLPHTQPILCSLSL